MNPVIETVSLSKIYGKKENTVHALRDCSLQFEAGSFTAVVGRSGSGKSTLLHLLGGLDEPTNGQVLVEGKNLYGISDKQRTLLRRRRIGFVFQFFNLLPELTAWQNIMLPLNLDHQKQDKAYIDEVIGTLFIPPACACPKAVSPKKRTRSHSSVLPSPVLPSRQSRETALKSRLPQWMGRSKPKRSA